MLKEAIILAGGLGTRLRPVVNELPKCMAPVAGKPFLHYVLNYLKKEGISTYILSVGYKSQDIINYINEYHDTLNVKYSLEDTPLGTGGAIKQACGITSNKEVLVVNGDTLYTADINTLAEFHKLHNAECSICLKPMKNFDRYGAVDLSPDNSIKVFKEKEYLEKGLINGGLYALNVQHFLDKELPDIFSFEKDYLERYVSQGSIFGMSQDEYFIDIGVPEDYARAQTELAGSI